MKAGDPLATLYLNKRELAESSIKRMQEAIVLSDEKPELPPLIYAKVSPEGVER